MEVTELQKLTEELFRLKAMNDELTAQIKINSGLMNGLKAIAMVELEKANMNNFRSGNMLISKSDKKSVKILDKNLLLNYLEEKGILRDSFNVTAAKATTIWNEEYELAKDNNDLDFILNGIPGLSEPETFTTISMRGK